MQGNRIRALTFACIAVLATRPLHGQTTGQPVGVNLAQQKRQLADREKWRTSGLRIPGASPAALRNRAIQQKTRMRPARFVSLASPGIGGSWISLGPLPLPSDASGIGLQDYNWVSGRATAISIDPNDPTGNTV